MSVASQTGIFETHDGLKLVRRHWYGPRPTRSFAIVHGLAEHSERYERVACWLAERGYSVHAFDRRGHGESQGTRIDAPSFDVLLDDIELFLAQLRAEEPRVPLLLLGHSMGGLEVAALLVRRKPRVEAAILSAPALHTRLGPLRLKLALARLIRRVLPRLHVPIGIDPHDLSRDPAVVEAYIADPRIGTTITVRLAPEIIAAGFQTLAGATNVSVPVLLLHGEADPICTVEGSQAFLADLGTEGSELRTYHGLRHEILNEPEWETVLLDLHEWIEKRVETPGAS